MEHADLSALATGRCNDMIVDASGRAYVGHFGFDLHARAELLRRRLCWPSSQTAGRQLAARALRFPNGAVITPDGGTLVVAETFGRRLTAFDIADDGALGNRRVWAELGVPPDGICLDTEGCIWVAVPRPGGFLRVAEGGDVRARVDLEGWGGYACMLGGEAGRTLFLLEALTADPDEMSGRGNGRIRTMEVDAPRSGLP